MIVQIRQIPHITLPSPRWGEGRVRGDTNGCNEI